MAVTRLETAGGRRRVSDRAWYKALISFVTLLLVICLAFFGALTVISYGPSPAARDLFVVSVMETSAAKFLAHLYFSSEEVENIIAGNEVAELEETSDSSLIQVPVERTDKSAIVVEEVRGNTFKGKMMIVMDPGRLMVGIAHDAFVRGVRGKTVAEIIERHGGSGGVNAGGFVDEGGKGDGSQPLGIVVSEGKLRWGSLGATYDIIGFDQEDKLVIGKMTGKEAMDRGVRDAVSFGPMLVVNGEPLEVKGFGSGLNPRTAIGQRADGAVLLLVLDGRQPNSLGASMSDVIDLMVRYEAVNAANLDGGGSTVMYQEGELINVCCSLYGPRDIPTAIVVRGPADGAPSGGESGNDG
ncbi:MAG: phosphodiester glycosidase family protein [Peptococcaceae bacterium]|jgi:exopolysaccharide biosynthesis protein|nr:phosphodiester glycosidase family protein [Peptococcaceae bacterium]